MPRKFVILTTVTAALCVGASGFQGAQAQQEYIPKAIVTPLHQGELPGMEGKEMVVRHFAIPPGFVGGKHIHPGPVFVYVLEGTLTVETDAGTHDVGPGELYAEELNTTMRGRNISTTEDLEILVFQVGDIGKPMMIKAD